MWLICYLTIQSIQIYPLKTSWLLAAWKHFINKSHSWTNGRMWKKKSSGWVFSYVFLPFTLCGSLFHPLRFHSASNITSVFKAALPTRNVAEVIKPGGRKRHTNTSHTHTGEGRKVEVCQKALSQNPSRWSYGLVSQRWKGPFIVEAGGCWNAATSSLFQLRMEKHPIAPNSSFFKVMATCNQSQPLPENRLREAYLTSWFCFLVVWW